MKGVPATALLSRLPLLRWIGSQSLERKLKYILSLSGLVALAITLLLLAFFDWTFSRNALGSRYESLGKVVATDVRAPLQRGDHVRAEEALQAFALTEGLIFSEVILADGTVFATEGTKPPSAAAAIERQRYVDARYWDAYVASLEPIWLDPETQQQAAPDAFVFLAGDLKPLYAAFLQKAALVALSLALLGWIVLRAAARMSRVITQPILELAETAKRISRELDYSHRQSKVFDDETGALVDAFNELMGKIEESAAIIHANEERFREYFELGIAGMAILGSDGQFVEANRQLGRMLEIDQQSLVGSRYDRWVDTKDRESQFNPFEQLKQDAQQGFRDELWLRCENGNRLFAIVSARRLAKAPGRDQELYLALFQDISGRKRAEEELKASKQAAEEANRSKDEFLSVVSHELRTPLNPIIGFVDLLIHSNPTEEQLYMLRSVRRSSEHLLNLITDILDFSRAQGGRLEADPEAFDLKELCASALEITQRSGVTNNVRAQMRLLDLSALPTGFSLFADAGKIRQIAINFLSNAIKYNKPGGSVWIDARVESMAEGVSFVRIDVEDNGIGISEEMLDRVFEPFTQLDMSLQRKQEGLGLGLSICKRIAECLGGNVSVKSEEGSGSTFTARIPVAFVEKSIAAKEPLPLLEIKPPQDPKPTMRVLLAEDDLENKRLIEAKLATMGIHFEWAKNGLEATRRVAQERFDLVLMDVRMPLMDGLEATRHIRTREMEEATGRLPIVAMTAHASDRMKVECARVGMDGYMSKPIQSDQLENYLKRYLAS